MKLLFTSAVLLLSFFSQAQIVNIPDPNFKQMLIYAGADLNGDGEIQTTEAASITNMSVAPLDFFDLAYAVTDYTGIKSFLNMKTLNLGCWLNATSTLDLSGMHKLENIQLQGYISFVNTHGISSLNLDGCTGLKNLYMEMQRIVSFDISTCTSLESVELVENEYLQTVNFGNLPNLTHLRMDECHSASELDLRGCINLSTISLFNAFQLNTLDISGLKKITSLADDFRVQNFKATNCTGLTDLNIGRTGIGGITNSIDLSGCVNLRNLAIAEASFSQLLDLGSCYRLSSLDLRYTNTKTINLKNGSLLSGVNISPVLNGKINICVDEFEPAQFKNLLLQSGAYDAASLANTFNTCTCCKFLPSSSYNTIKGNVRLDLNNDGCNSSDPGVENIPVQILRDSGDSITRFTALNGAYAHYPYEGNFTITPTVPPHFNVTPLSASVSFDTANSIVKVINFCLKPAESANDLEIAILPLSGAVRPGRDVSFRLFYKNVGTATASGNVEFYFEQSRFNYVGSSVTTASQSGGLVKWNFNNLLPLTSGSIDITLNVLPPPVNNNGDSVKFMSTVNPVAGDITPGNNSVLLVKTIRTSIDPNFKECLQGNKVDIDKAGEFLYYQVHFQNIGGDTAFNVVITDPLDEKLNLSTLELVNSSFPCNVSLKGNEVEFFFDDIKLPAQLVNDAGSNGFVVYRIKAKNPLALLNDSIVNNAAIYFDFNLPVSTNNVSTLFVTSSVPLPVKLEYFTLSHIGSYSNKLTWKAVCSGQNVRFEIERSTDAVHFKKVGQINSGSAICISAFQYTDNDLLNGKLFYRIKIIGENSKVFYSKVLSASNNKSGIDIKAVSGNMVYCLSDKQQSVSIKILSFDGKEILAKREELLRGDNIVELPLQRLSSGGYIILISKSNGELITKKFIK